MSGGCLAREGAAVCELTDLLELSPDWPEGSRLLCRRERPHPGAQLSFTDHEGHRFQCFITDQAGEDIAWLEVRHRARARAEDASARAARAVFRTSLRLALPRGHRLLARLLLKERPQEGSSPA